MIPQRAARRSPCRSTGTTCGCGRGGLVTAFASAVCGRSKTRRAGLASSGVRVLGFALDAVPPRRDCALAWGIRDGQKRWGAAVGWAALPSASASTAESIFA